MKWESRCCQTIVAAAAEEHFGLRAVAANETAIEISAADVGKAVIVAIVGN